MTRRPKARAGEPLAFLQVLGLRTVERCILWPYAENGKGYGTLRVDGSSSTASRVACRIHHGPPPSPKHETAHSCGVRLCVNPAHLRWALPVENCADRDEHGTTALGQRHGRAKLTDNDVRRIREAWGTSACNEILNELDVTRSHGWKIANRHIWRHVK